VIVFPRLLRIIGARLSAIEPLSQSDRANSQPPAFQTARHPSQGELVLLASTIRWAKGNIMSTNMSRMLFSESHASTSQECQQKAADCLRLVPTLRDSTNKAILLEMAEAWISFAEQQKAEVNSTPKRAAY
jgi:hypothetical protein